MELGSSLWLQGPEGPGGPGSGALTGLWAPVLDPLIGLAKGLGCLQAAAS